MSKQIKIIDLFSGPGGLGEGFSALFDEAGNHPFKIAVSIEKEKSAHRTLTLRAFFRQFGNKVPAEYYQFLKGSLGKSPEDELYNLFPDQYSAAQDEALYLELGKDNEIINSKIQNAIGNDECILIGGPPCQAYSLAGRARNKGKVDYRPEDDDRNFLYKEYLNVIAKFQPKIFVMENVKGMLSAKVEGKSIYETIFNDLHNPGLATGEEPRTGFSSNRYKIRSLVKKIDTEAKVDPKDFVIKSEDFGIPQKRHRVILIGIREDLADCWSDDYLLIKSPQVALETVIKDLPFLRSGLSKGEDSGANWLSIIRDQSVDTVKALREHQLIDVANNIEQMIPRMKSPKLGKGKLFGLKREYTSLLNKKLKKWYFDDNLGTIVSNHETRGHITSDLQRYLFCSTWAKVYENDDNKTLTPKSGDYPVALMPNHKNFQTGKFADRFRVQPWGIPATTITSHISKDGHYFIHPDPLQCRSFTVREAARIQTFPDNYFFVGTRTQQYVQVGNAVPPLLANCIANIINKIISK